MTSFVNALPERSTLKLNPGQRALGNLARLPLSQEPAGAAQADLAGDAFWELYATEPQPLESVPADRAVNRALLDWMKGTHGYEASRTSTQANMPAAMTASALMWELLTTDEALQDALKQQEEAAEQQQRADSFRAQANALETAAQAMGISAGAGELRTRAADLQQQADAAQQAANSAAARAMAAVQQTQASPYQQAKMASFAQQAAQQADDAAKAAAGWGMGPGSAVNTDPRQALAFLKANSGKMQQIAALAGRMRGFALDARRNRVVPAGAPASVGMTRDITKLLPTEAFLLRSDVPAAVRLKQAQQFLEGGLPGYIPQEAADERGPFVAAVDVSPSMWGQRELIAKAVALGVAQSARTDGRDYTLYAFASDARQVTTCQGRQDWQAHMAWAAASQRGGTDFNMALMLAMENLEALDAERADCLFISDGEAGIAPETAQRWRAFAERAGARLFYVPVGRGGYVDIELLAYRVIEVGELDEHAGTDAARQLGRLL